MNTELLAAHMSLVLDEPAQVARNLAIRWVTSSQGSYKRWLKYSKANSATIIELADELKNQDVESLVAFLNFNRSKGVVLTTIHMGDYLIALLSILKDLKNRKIFIVRRKEEDAVEAGAFSHIASAGIDFEVIRMNEPQIGLKIFRRLKAGHVVIMLFDLSHRFGETVCINFMGKAMNWVRGPADMAAKSEAFLVPIVSYFEGYRAVCNVHSVQAPSKGTDIRSLVQYLADVAEPYVRAYPEQWVQWSEVPRMLSETPATHHE